MFSENVHDSLSTLNYNTQAKGSFVNNPYQFLSLNDKINALLQDVVVLQNFSSYHSMFRRST